MVAEVVKVVHVDGGYSGWGGSNSSWGCWWSLWQPRWLRRWPSLRRREMEAKVCVLPACSLFSHHA